MFNKTLTSCDLNCGRRVLCRRQRGWYQKRRLRFTWNFPKKKRRAKTTVAGQTISTGTAEPTGRAPVPGTRSCPRWSPSTWPCTSPCRPGSWASGSVRRGRAGSTAAGAPVAAARTVLPRWALRRRRPARRTRTPVAANPERTSWRSRRAGGCFFSAKTKRNATRLVYAAAVYE